ncbi:MAG: metal-sensing transcriptional repressor [Ottowia sp.]|nr:metal-sensing transcriptional repressor [Ottowia sp.]
MPHSPEDKKRAITRLRRIRGQAEALERSIAEGADCGPVLQQLAAMRGAVNGLMADVLEGHLRECFGHADCAVDSLDDPAHARTHEAIDEVASLVRSYLK